MTVGLALPGLASAAAAPRIYTSPAQFTASNGSSVSVPVRVDPNGAEIDTVEINVSFPESQLTFQSVDKGGSVFDTFVPGTPTVSKGTIEFSAARLKKTVTSDSLVGTLIFTSRAGSGSGTIDLSGSAAARSGSEVSVTTENASVNFGASGSQANKVAITGIKVTDVVVNGGTVNWSTSVPATSSVDYGVSTHYGFTSGSGDLTTTHSVKLQSVFAGNDTVHYNITSRDANGNAGTSGDNTFTTAGYTVAIKAFDKGGKALSGASVKVNGGAAVKADASGVATVRNVGPGNQKVVINNGKTQFIAVKALNGAKATQIQKFDVTAEPNPAPIMLIGFLVLVALAALLTVLLRQRAAKSSGGSKE